MCALKISLIQEDSDLSRQSDPGRNLSETILGEETGNSKSSVEQNPVEEPGKNSTQGKSESSSSEGRL